MAAQRSRGKATPAPRATARKPRRRSTTQIAADLRRLPKARARDVIRKATGLDPFALVETLASGGFGAPAPRWRGDMAEAFGEVPWVYVAVDRIASIVSSLPPAVLGRDDQPVEEHRITKALLRPSPAMSGVRLLYSIAASYKLWGEAFVLHDGTPARPGGFIPLMPRRVRPIPDKDLLYAGWLVRTPDGKQVRLDREAIIPMVSWNPNTDLRGFAPLQPAWKAAATDDQVYEHEMAFFRNGTKIGGVLSTDQSIGPELRQQMADEWTSAHSGPDGLYRVAVLDNGLKFSGDAMAPKDLEAPKLMEWNRRVICSVFGVPPIWVGDFESTAYANAREQDRQGLLHTVLPLVRCIESALNMYFAPLLSSRRERFAFDLSSIEPLISNTGITAESAVKLQGTGAFTPNEIRRVAGFKPLEDPVADQLPQPAQPQLGPLALGVAPGVTGSKGDSHDSVTLDLRVPAVAKGEAPTGKPNSRVFLPSMSRTVTLWRGELRGITEGILEKTKERIAHDVTDAASVPSPASLAPPKEEVRAAYQALAEELVPTTIKTFGDGVMGKLGRIISAGRQSRFIPEGDVLHKASGLPEFDPQQQAVLKAIKQRIMVFAGAPPDTFVEQIRRAIARSFEELGGAADTRVRIRAAVESLDLVDQLRRAKDFIIATTEVGAALSLAQHHAMVQSKVVRRKSWGTAGDAFVRQDHIDVESATSGSPILLEESFLVGGATLLHPQESGGPPEQVINCRCYEIPSEFEVPDAQRGIRILEDGYKRLNGVSRNGHFAEDTRGTGRW